jgi:hypothetical protein
MKISGHVVILLIVLSAIHACKKEDASNSPAGHVNGLAYLCGTDGSKDANSSGILVRIEGTGISTTTGANGQWRISNVKEGMYTFTFSKQGFGTYKQLNQQIVIGEQSLDTTKLYPIPLYTVTFSSESIDTDGIYFKGHLTGVVPEVSWIRFFFSKTHPVSSDPANHIYDVIGLGAENFDISITNTLYGNGFAKGDSVYLVGYTDFLVPTGQNVYSTISYSDVKTGRYIYPNLNPTPSNIFKLVLP